MNTTLCPAPPIPARHLRIRISREGATVVSVALPASQTGRLRELIPADVLPRILASGIDVDGIAGRAVAGGLVPQNLFTLRVGDRQYEVGLE
jgi:hypothetical protein